MVSQRLAKPSNRNVVGVRFPLSPLNRRWNMKIVKPSIELIDEIDGQHILDKIERIGRICYKSEASISDGSAELFVRNLIKRGHESVLEHISITVKVICDRGVSHEIVRHRIASYTQESSRYCNYSKGAFNGEITVIEPSFWKRDTYQYNSWKTAAEMAEKSYMIMIQNCATPQEARSVLPNSLKTELVMTMNLREWRHFLKLRTAKNAHPQMREVAGMILKEFKDKMPVIFDDIT